MQLDDTIVKTIETSPSQELKEARELILRIRRRNLYQFCNEYPVPKDMLDNFKKVTAQDIVCSQVFNLVKPYYLQIAYNFDYFSSLRNSILFYKFHLTEEWWGYTERGGCCCLQCQH